MRTFKDLDTLAYAPYLPEGVYREIQACYTKNGIPLDIPFNDALGGDVYIVETKNDLDEVFKDAGFDVAHEIPMTEYYFAFTAISDAGGPSYFIPNSLIIDNEAFFDNFPEKETETARGPLEETTRVNPITGGLETRKIANSPLHLDIEINFLANGSLEYVDYSA